MRSFKDGPAPGPEDLGQIDRDLDRLDDPHKPVHSRPEQVAPPPEHAPGRSPHQTPEVAPPSPPDDLPGADFTPPTGTFQEHLVDLNLTAPRELLEKTFKDTEGLPGSGDDEPPPGSDEVRLLWMTQRIAERQSRTLEHLKTILWSITGFRWVGWLLLVLAGFDYLGLFYDLELANAASELRTIEQFVDRVPVPLLGMVLIFWGGTYGRSTAGLFVLKGLSVVCLMMGMGMVLMTPLAVVDSQRVQQEQFQQIQKQQQAFEQNWSNARDRLQAAESPEALKDWFESVSQRTVAIDTPKQAETFKSRGGIMMQQLREQQMAKISEAYEKNRWKSWLRSLRLGAGSLLGGSLFIFLYFTTRWARATEFGLWHNLVNGFHEWRMRRERRKARGQKAAHGG